MTIQIEKEVRKGQEMFSPCGLYCGTCGVLIAHRTNDQSLKEAMSKRHHCTVADIECDGCFSENRFIFCRVCEIRSCVIEKNYEGCHECDQFPCPKITENDEFSPVARKLITRSVADRRRLGTRQWSQREEERYRCPHCHHIFPRGLDQCFMCGTTVKIVGY